ncbi:hypothetical protein JCM19239_5806 [Vibrio variabilis]|uniref:Uncharacterized protein n=1 Tax=Vibrio variabilis TaxID=990271 RepID=A0ABQ0J881_9VIBR|nr:hypothetical protein JCM19239_5806 [Vibrio variabilis]
MTPSVYGDFESSPVDDVTHFNGLNHLNRQVDRDAVMVALMSEPAMDGVNRCKPISSSISLR